jgi:hypothetical protein
MSATQALDLVPFYSFNQSPLVQIYGLPTLGSGAVLPPHQTSVELHYGLANNYTTNNNANENLILDGETRRTTLVVKRGYRSGFEAGVEIPYISHVGGNMDSFIDNWHDFFGFPDGGRSQAPKDRLLYRYARNGTTRFNIEQSEQGVGDVRLAFAQSLNAGAQSTAASLRASLKLPTGNEAKLMGSDAPDLALWLSAACGVSDCTEFGWYGGGGLLWLGSGEVLPEMQQKVVGFGSAGLSWQAFSSVAVKTQIDAHTPFYSGSDFEELSSNSAQVILGATFSITRETQFDLSISEDIVVNTAPDVSFHLGLRSRF